MATSIPSFTAGGLASGLDTGAIVDGLVQLRSAGIRRLQNRQAAIRTQVSAVGETASKLKALRTAAGALGASGLRAYTAASTSAAFGATASAGGAQPGRYSITVDQLAAAAQARSQGFESATAPVAGGTLTLQVGTGTWNVAIADGTALTDVAAAVNRSGAPVVAGVLSDGHQSYLFVNARETGFALGAEASGALQLTESTTGGTGRPLAAAVVRTAKNALVTVDGLQFERRSNTVADAIAGVSLTLRAQTTAGEELVVDGDAAATKARLQGFVDALNAVVGDVLAKTKAARDATGVLAGDGTLTRLGRSLQELVSRQVGGSGPLRSLAALGVKTTEDGTIAVDDAAFRRALAASPADADTIFTRAGDGVAALVDSLGDRYLDPLDGVLVSYRTSMSDAASGLDDDIARAQARVDAFRAGLVAQFNALEQVMSGLKATGQFLAQQEAVWDRRNR